MDQPSASEEREKAKKFWLIYFVASTVLSFHTYIINYLLEIKLHLTGLPWAWAVGVLGFLIVCMAIGSFAIYRCAYTKPGTKFLKLIIASHLLVFPGILFFGFGWIVPKWLTLQAPIDWGIGGVYIGMELATTAIGLYASWKLHSANMRYKNILKLV